MNDCGKMENNRIDFSYFSVIAILSSNLLHFMNDCWKMENNLEEDGDEIEIRKFNPKEKKKVGEA